MTQADASPRLDAGADVIAACRRLHAAIDALDQAAADLLGISRGDLRCLNLLEHGPIHPKQIATALGITPGSVTVMIDRLEAKGLVDRTRTPGDRRGVLVSATPLVFRSVGQLYRFCATTLSDMVLSYPAAEQLSAIKHLSDAAAAWNTAVKLVPYDKIQP